MAKDKKEKKDKEDELPDLWFIFDLRGEYWGDIANHAVMVKKGDQYDDIMKFASNLGLVQELQFTTAIKDVDVDEAQKLFEDEGYIVTKAEEDDFAEIQRELDKLMTIKTGQHEKYKGKYKEEHR